MSITYINNEYLKNPKFFLKVLDSSPDGFLLSDNKGNVLYVNDAYVSVTGIKKDEILGKNLKELQEKKIFNKSVSLMVLEKKETISMIHRYVSGKDALTTASPIFNEENEIVGVVNNTRNVTELVSLRKELEKVKELSEKYSDELQKLRKEQLKHEGLVYKSEAMAKTLELALRAAEYDSTVLITGESGTGKEVIAKFIHSHSNRKDGPFIRVNCSAIPSELFESELFGYVPGSFTGASVKGKKGMFELADGGTILLDEVGELDLSVQPKLLRALQEMEIHPVGAEKPVKIDVRVLAATNVNFRNGHWNKCPFLL